MEELTSAQVEQLCQWAGVLRSDAAAVAILKRCYRRAHRWYTDAGCDMADERIEDWVCDLATWFYDHRGADDVEIPPYILHSVHQLRP